jgi:hypothetical protein
LNLPSTAALVALLLFAARKPHYGPRKSKIIMKHLAVLKANGWIHKCYGAWGSAIVLAAKLHQEHIVRCQILAVFADFWLGVLLAQDYFMFMMISSGC